MQRSSKVIESSNGANRRCLHSTHHASSMADECPEKEEAQFLLNGSPATIIYDPAKKQVSIKSSDETSISQSDIIGVAPNEGCLAYNLIYVEQPAKQEESSNDPSFPVVKSVEFKDLPSAFVSDYTIQSQTERQRDGLPHWEKIPTTHIVVSTLSGTGLAPSFYSSVLQPLLTILNLREHKHYVVHYTRSARTVIELTENVFLPQANEGVSQRIILLSGDGGVVDVVNGMMSKRHTTLYNEPRIILIPMGTGNALAHSTSITRDNTWGLSTLARGKPEHLPLVKAMFSPGARLLVNEGNGEEEIPIETVDGNPVLFGAVVCSWGLHAALVADSDTTEYRKYGLQRFKMAVKENLFPSDGSTSHAYRAKLSLLKRDADDDEKWAPVERDAHSYVLAALVSNLEKTFVISPKSKPLDGQLRVVHFGRMSGEEVMRIMRLAYQNGKHIEEKEVGYEDVEGIGIEFAGTEKDGRWRRICVDGKIVRVEEDGWVEVTKGTSKVLQLNILR